MRVMTEQVEILAPHHIVWAILEDFGAVDLWAPYMKKSVIVGFKQAGVGASRAMRHAWGFNFEETVTEWTDGEGFSFDVHRAPFPMKNVHEIWDVVRENGISTVITQVNYNMRLGILGRWLDWILVRYVVRREMRAGLRGLRQYVEHEVKKAELLQYAD